MEIVFLNEFDSELRDLLTGQINKWENEIKTLLPHNPPPSLVKFDNKFLIDGHGTGGFADTDNILILAFQLDYPDRVKQLSNLRASYLHESYHLGQGWVGDVKLEPIAEAILEGAATVFERDRAKSEPEWAKYYDRNTMLDLLGEVLNLDDTYDHQKWKYHDQDSGRSFLLYRLGTFIVDEALSLNPNLNIEMLIDKKASEILELSKLPVLE